MGCRVCGVEIDPVAAEAAREWCDEVAVADLGDLDLSQRFEGQTFDVVLMLDILEHLPDPVGVLRGVARILDDEGWAVISLPNVAHLSVRLALLDGHFDYKEAGLLDRTHLRFFDRAGVDELLFDAGWAMFDLERVTRRLGETEIEVDDPNPDLVRQLESDPEALTYQFVISAAPKGHRVLDCPPVLPAATAQARYLELEREVLGAPAVVTPEIKRPIRDRRGLTIPDLAEQLAAIRNGSLNRRNQLRFLLEAMQEDTERLRRSMSD